MYSILNQYCVQLVPQMAPRKQIRRRGFLGTIAASVSLAGCLEQLGMNRNRLGVIDAADVSYKANDSAQANIRNIQRDNNDSTDHGLEISTNDSMTDGQVTVDLLVNIPNAIASTIFIDTDVDELDDDTEVEIRFQSEGTTYRRIFIGNEYKTRTKGVLATETGKGYTLRQKLKSLPAPENQQTTEIEDLERIQFAIIDGDFSGKIWALWFIFEDRSIGIL